MLRRSVCLGKACPLWETLYVLQRTLRKACLLWENPFRAIAYVWDGMSPMEDPFSEIEYAQEGLHPMGDPFWAIAYAWEACLLWGTCANLQYHRTSLHCYADTYTQKLTMPQDKLYTVKPTLTQKRQCRRTTLHCCVFVLSRHIPWTLAPSLKSQYNRYTHLVTCKPISINTQVSNLNTPAY